MQQTKQQNIVHVFLLLASVCIILASLKIASVIIVPFLISLAFAIMLSPLLHKLTTFHIPKVFSIVIIILIAVIPIISLITHAGAQAHQLLLHMDDLKLQMLNSVNKFIDFTAKFGFDIKKEDIILAIDQSNITDIIKNLIKQAGNQFSNIFIILFSIIFMLLESDSFYQKVIYIQQKYHTDATSLLQNIEKIKSYFLIKAKTSLLTATWILAILYFYDIKYFYLWATLAFFFNFIPVVGSIFAAIPPILLTLLSQEWLNALYITIWYVVINITIGNILEPKIMGKGLGLSALVIFLSMNFWGWMFGPAGMILSVPLTMSMQFLFAKYETTQWFSLLLSDYPNTKQK